MITVHHLEDSRSLRVLWLLECLELDYQVKGYRRDPKTSLAPQELLNISPLGKAPIVEVDGVTLAESGAIFQYLLTKFDSNFLMHPAHDSELYKDYLFWLHFAEGSLAWPLVIRLLHQKVLEKAPFGVSTVAKLIFLGIEKAYLEHTIDYAFQHIESVLSSSKYFLGEKMSAVDVMMSFPLEAAFSGRVKSEQYPRISRFLNDVHKDEAYLRALHRSEESLPL